MKPRLSQLWLLVAFMAETNALISKDIFLTSVSPSLSIARRQSIQQFILFAAPSHDDDDDDDDETEEDIALGDWRKFRASLIHSGLPGADDVADQKEEKAKSKKSVAKENEKLLQEQNQELAREYQAGVWAHVVAEPEVGGLLCRLPIEAEIYLGANGGYWKEKLSAMLSLDLSYTSKKKEGEEEEALNDAKVAHWFSVAERMISRELESITANAKGGILNPNDLERNERDLLDRYMNYKQTWQEVCLLLAHTPETGCSESVVINRPITKAINSQLAKLVLEGPGGDEGSKYDYGFIDKFVQAFGQSGAVYMGGPDRQSEPALLLHGISDLEGATEISPGTGIYQGGMEGAVEGILEGKYKPLEFRFFLGRQVCNPDTNPEARTLLDKVTKGEYQPVACARSVALKQCLGLPKPLWHEVLELCGGLQKSISDVELAKRLDLLK